MEKKLKTARASARSKFTRKANLLAAKLDAGDSGDVLRLLYDEMSTAFTEVESRNENLVQHYLDAEEENEESVKETEKYIEEVEKRKIDLYSSLVKEKSKQVTIKIKALPPPTFDGDMRRFGTFIKDYDRLMLVKYGKDPYSLISCLSGEALECVKGVEDSYEAMLSRLKDKYGNPCKITDSIMRDVKLLRPIPDGDPKKLVHAVNVIERAWLDMCKIGLEEEMSSIAIVTLIERLLPRKLQHDWVLKAGELTPEGEEEVKLFKKLLDFLLREKQICEYLDCDLRSTNNKLTSCSLNCETKEISDDTKEFKIALNEMKLSQDKHNTKITECLTNVAKLLSGIPDRKNFVSNDRMKKNCWLHNVQGHDISMCYIFQKLTPQDKLYAMRNNNVCYRCLDPGYIAKFCNISKVTCDVSVNDQNVVLTTII